MNCHVNEFTKFSFIMLINILIKYMNIVDIRHFWALTLAFRNIFFYSKYSYIVLIFSPEVVLQFDKKNTFIAVHFIRNSTYVIRHSRKTT